VPASPSPDERAKPREERRRVDALRRVYESLSAERARTFDRRAREAARTDFPHAELFSTTPCSGSASCARATISRARTCDGTCRREERPSKRLAEDLEAEGPE